MLPFKPIEILRSCISLPTATITARVPVYKFAFENEELAQVETKQYYTCCGKSICKGCVYSFCESGNIRTCPFCKADIIGKTDEEIFEALMKQVETNDAGAMTALGSDYYHGKLGLLRDCEKALELWKQAATLGYSHAHFHLGNDYYDGGV